MEPLLVRSHLYRAGERIGRVFFPQEGVVSFVVEDEDDVGVEYSAVGREGMVGLPLILGADTHANARIFTQVPGRALVLDSESFASHARDGSPLHSVLLRYGQFLVDQASQTAACNGMHSIEQRCAKWLLVIHDRVEGDEFDLADEFLEHMLGVKAGAVVRVTTLLRDEGLIDSPRQGAYEIVDRDGLEDAACDCYRVVTDAYEKVSA